MSISNTLNSKKLDSNKIEIPESQWIHKWGIDKENAEQLYQMILDSKPEVIIETGTFEGQGTYVLAQAAHHNNNKCRIYTIDYDGDPTSSDITQEQWLQLKTVRSNNIENINKKFPNCEVIFLDGDSRQVLPNIFDKYNEKKCDFFYQDSMHFFDGIMSEWKIIEPYLVKDSICIFDDLWLKNVQKFRDWFFKNYSNTFECFNNLTGHKQLITKKL